MPDHRPFTPGVPIAEALQVLPLEAPSRSPLAALLQAQQRQRRRTLRRHGWAGLAVAAMLGLAVWLPINPSLPPSAVVEPTGDVIALQNESARLEALLAAAASDPLRPADAVLMGLSFEDDLRGIDLALGQDSLEPAAREALWRQRVALLADYADMEASRRWLASEGKSYQTTLVSTF